MITKRDLALAYSPGVAVPVVKISEDPMQPMIIQAKETLLQLLAMDQRF